MTKRFTPRGEGFETYDKVNGAFIGVLELVDESIGCIIERQKKELQQLEQRSKFLSEYLPGQIADAAQQAMKEGADEPVIVSAFQLLDGDYNGDIGIAEDTTPPTPDELLLKGPAAHMFWQLRKTGLRPHLAWERRFNRGNGRRPYCLCVFVEAQPKNYLGS
jgi:hypothetical protein